MDDALGMTPAQRRMAAEVLCAQVRAWIEDPRSTFRISITRGMEARGNRATGDSERRPNGSITLQLEINGGAHDTTGPDVVPFTGRIAQPPGEEAQ